MQSMADNKDQGGLSPDERAELEELRREKAQAQQKQQAQQERAELNRLREEKVDAERNVELDKRIAAEKERGRKLMEPDEDDLKMPPGQKMVIAAVIIIAVVFILSTIFS
jgi:hypothetical protein